MFQFLLLRLLVSLNLTMIHDSTPMPNLLYRDHVQLTNKRKILVEIVEIIRTLLLLFSFRPVTYLL